MRIKCPKLRNKSTSSTEESGIKSHELRNFCEQIKCWQPSKFSRGLLPLNVSKFSLKNSSFSYYKSNNNVIYPRFSFCFFLIKNEKMQVKCRVQKIKVECRSNQNKRLANTFDRNFDQTRNESLVLRAVLHVFRAH